MLPSVHTSLLASDATPILKCRAALQYLTCAAHLLFRVLRKRAVQVQRGGSGPLCRTGLATAIRNQSNLGSTIPALSLLGLIAWFSSNIPQARSSGLIALLALTRAMLGYKFGVIAADWHLENDPSHHSWAKVKVPSQDGKPLGLLRESSMIINVRLDTVCQPTHRGAAVVGAWSVMPGTETACGETRAGTASAASSSTSAPRHPVRGFPRSMRCDSRH
eukprot:2903833-Rhodomonas_salina.2